MKAGKGKARPKRAKLDSQALLREVQIALAVARCIRLAVEYDDDDCGLDIADALAGLLIFMQRIAAALDQPEVSP